jgi:hypothetical protein
MTSIVLTVPLGLINSLLSMLPILLPPTNLSLSTWDMASKKNMHLSLVLAIEKQKLQTSSSFWIINAYFVKDMSATLISTHPSRPAESNPQLSQR